MKIKQRKTEATWRGFVPLLITVSGGLWSNLVADLFDESIDVFAGDRINTTIAALALCA